MIEFLDEHREGFWEDWELVQANSRGVESGNILYGTGAIWIVRLVPDVNQQRRLAFSNRQLCDALWEAVKQVLESNV